jgi:hypothetical protein
MIPVQLTCESEPIPSANPAADAHRPLIRLNGEPIWRGRPEPTPEDAERVALAYLRYSLGGALGGDSATGGGPRFAPPPKEEAGEPAENSATAFLSEAVDALGAEMVDALKRVNAFIESGEWKRFLR